jgi:cytochrome bd-type quinol oxidase subunit 2
MADADPSARPDTGVMDDLHRTLDELLAPGAPPNAAFDALVGDYVRFHLALAVLGGVFLLGVIALTVLAVRHLRSASRHAAAGRRFRRLAGVCVVVGGTCLSAGLGVVVAANLSTAASPRQGLADSLALIGDPAPGSRAETVQQGFTDWLRSGEPSPPQAVRRAVDRRLAWQRPKALICAALLVVTVVVAVRTWRALLRTTGEVGHRWGVRTVAHVAGGAFVVAASLLLMVMVMGNGQASIAPVAMTLFFG